MGIDVNVLANINQITNIDLIWSLNSLDSNLQFWIIKQSLLELKPKPETSTTPVKAEANSWQLTATVNGHL